MKHFTKPLLALITLALAGCGGVAIKAISPPVPKALIVPFPANVGVHYPDDFRSYVHEEERWGGKWQVALGESHVNMLEQITRMAFTTARQVPEPKASEPGIDLVLQPHIDRFSFITPRDSGGEFFAVTIQYRLDVFAPDGRQADTLTFTGYGGAPAKGMSSAKPLLAATQAAMRDAAAKFLTQFPEQKVAQRMRAGEPLVEEKQLAQAAGSQEEAQEQTGKQTENVKIEPVPIFDSPDTADGL